MRFVRHPKNVPALLGRAAVNLMYFKRYRMEIALTGRDLSLPDPEGAPPPGYRFEPWSPALLDAFAEAKYASFRSEMDANVFPCLGELDGCRRLMREIARKPGFLPGTTWLLSWGEVSRGTRAAGCREYCGTVQGDSRRRRARLDPEPGHRAGAP